MAIRWKIAALCCLLITFIAVAACAENTLALPSGVTTIEEEAFMGLKHVDRINLPGGVTEIGSRAFANSSVKEIYLPATVVCIADDALEGSPDAKFVSDDALWDGVFKYAVDGDHAVIKKYMGASAQPVIPSQINGLPVTSIGSEAFRERDDLTHVVIPDGVTAIGSYAFDQCANLTSVHMPDSVTSVQDRAFSYCASLTDVTFSRNLTDIGSDAFRDSCTAAGIHYFDLPDGLTNFGWKPFQYCGAVLCVSRGSSSESIIRQNQYEYTHYGEKDFRYRWYSSEGERLMKYTGTAAEAVEIPGYVWLIDDNAFRDHNELAKVVIPEGVTTLGFNAFRDCENLTDITLPSTLTQMKDNVFCGCGTAAAEPFVLELPSGLSGVGPGAFDSANMILLCDKESTAASSISNRGYSFARKDRPDTELDIRYRWGYYNNVWQWGLYDYVGSASQVRLPDDCERVDGYMFRQKPDLELVCAQLSETAAGLSRAEVNFTFPGHAGMRYRVINDVLYIMGYARTATEITIPKANAYIAAGVDEQIRAGAFQGRETLTKVVIPEGVTRINDGAFTNCYLLTDITFPSTLKSLDQNVFRYCGRDAENVFYFVLPDNMESMAGRGGGATTFSDVNAVLVCGKTSRTAALLTESNYVYTCPGEYDFRYRYEENTENGGTGRRVWLVGYTGTSATATIPEGIYGIRPFSSDTTSSYYRTFYGNAFYGNETVKKVVIPEGTEEIRDGSFVNCYKLTNITFPSTLKTLEQNVFRYCGRDAAGVFYFVLPDNLESVVGRGGGAQTFSDCNAVLQTGKYSKTAEVLTDANFCYTVAGERDFRYRYRSYIDNNDLDRELWLVGYAGPGGEVTIPEGIYGVRQYQWNPPYGDEYEPDFYRNETVTKLVIPEGTVWIEDSAFYGCANLTDITFPSTLKVLKNHAFEQCGKNATYTHYYVLPDDMEEISTTTANSWGSFGGLNKGVLVCAYDSETARLLSNVYTNHYNGSYMFALKGHETDGLIYRYERYGEEGAYEYKLVLQRYDGSDIEVNIPSGCGIYGIANGAFSGKNVQKVVIPNGVQWIGASAFDGCDVLHESTDVNVITLPGSLKTIGDLAFRDVGSSYLERFYLVLPSSLEFFNINIFTGCRAVLVAPMGSYAAGVLHDNFYYYYFTLEDAMAQRNVQFKPTDDPEHTTYHGRP